MSTDRWMNKEAVVLIHNGICILSHKKNTFESGNEADEPRSYYTEWSKSEKDKYCILMHIYMESRKMVPMNLFAGQQWRNRNREEIYGCSRVGREEGEGEMYGKSNMET